MTTLNVRERLSAARNEREAFYEKTIPTDPEERGKHLRNQRVVDNNVRQIEELAVSLGVIRKDERTVGPNSHSYPKF